MRRAARAQKMAEFEKWKNPPKANFVISKRLGGEEGAEVCIIGHYLLRFECLTYIHTYLCVKDEIS